MLTNVRDKLRYNIFLFIKFCPASSKMRFRYASTYLIAVIYYLKFDRDHTLPGFNQYCRELMWLAQGHKR